MKDYDVLLNFLKADYMSVCQLLEPKTMVKIKEEVAHLLVNIFDIENIADEVLANIVVEEIASNENESLIFRGNSIATKSMEAFMRLVGKNYLDETLKSAITNIIESDDSFEVDPHRVCEDGDLAKNQENLAKQVAAIWENIEKSHLYFSNRLQRCFWKIRGYLKTENREHMVNKLISIL